MEKSEKKNLTAKTSKAPTSLSSNLPPGPLNMTSARRALSPSSATTLAHFAK